MPKRYEYLKELISETTWNIAQKLEEKEADTGDGIIPRKITLEINLRSNSNDLPITTQETFEFGKAYSNQMAAVYSCGLVSMGFPSWYTSDPQLIVGRKIFDQMLHKMKRKELAKAKKQLKKIGKKQFGKN